MTSKNNQFTRKFLLIELLQSFEKKEIAQLYIFVTSAYFNKDKFVIKLLKALKKHVINRQPFDETTQHKVYKEIFGATNTNSLVLTKEQKKLLWIKMTLLNGLARRFLAIEALKNNAAYEVELIHQQLLEKKQYKSLEKLIKKRQVQLENKSIKDEQYYNVGFHIEKSKMNMLYQTGEIIKEDNFLTLNHHLDMNYLIHKLEFCLTMHSIANANNQKSYNFDSIDAIINLLNTALPITNPLINLYLTVIQLLKAYKEEDYLNLLKLLDQYSSYISQKILLSFYNVACNFCVVKIRERKIYYYEELLKLYKIIDKENLLIIDGFIQTTELKNMVVTGTHLGHFDWAIMITHKYKHYVVKENQESIYHLNLGIIEFYKKNFKQAISHLIRVEKFNISTLLDARMLLLRSHYELDKEYDQRTVQIFRSTDLFIRKHQTLPFSRKKSYKNFIQILIGLYYIRHKIGKRTLEGLQNKLNKMDLINDKKWLIDKIKALAS